MKNLLNGLIVLVVICTVVLGCNQDGDDIMTTPSLIWDAARIKEIPKEKEVLRKKIAAVEKSKIEHKGTLIKIYRERIDNLEAERVDILKINGIQDRNTLAENTPNPDSARPQVQRQAPKQSRNSPNQNPRQQNPQNQVQQNQGNKVQLRVNSPADGWLALRSRANSGSRLIAKIPHGTLLRVGSCTKRVRSGRLTGRWCRVQYGAMSGWAFDYYLT